MKLHWRYSCLVIAIAAMLSSCNNDSNDQQNTKPELTQKDVNNGLIKSHQEFLLQQEDEIKQYIARHNFTMQRTATGIYYNVLEHGTGDKAEVGEVATVEYSISLLDGTICYDTKGEPKQFKIGEDEVESGVHEAVQLMHIGDKAMFIIPSNLANGLVGDRDKIPPAAIVIYNIKLLALTKTRPSLSK